MKKLYSLYGDFGKTIREYAFYFEVQPSGNWVFETREGLSGSVLTTDHRLEAPGLPPRQVYDEFKSLWQRKIRLRYTTDPKASAAAMCLPMPQLADIERGLKPVDALPKPRMRAPRSVEELEERLDNPDVLVQALWTDAAMVVVHLNANSVSGLMELQGPDYSKPDLTPEFSKKSLDEVLKQVKHFLSTGSVLMQVREDEQGLKARVLDVIDGTMPREHFEERYRTLSRQWKALIPTARPNLELAEVFEQHLASEAMGSSMRGSWDFRITYRDELWLDAGDPSLIVVTGAFRSFLARTALTVV